MGPAGDDGVLVRMLQALRLHMDMDVAYLSRNVDGAIEVIAHDGIPGEQFSAAIDGSDAADGYCCRMMTGDLPAVIPDTAANPITAKLPITSDLDIGAYLGVPVNRSDGSTLGMLCCLSQGHRPDLTDRDRAVLTTFAGVAADLMAHQWTQSDAAMELSERIRATIRDKRYDLVFQPINDLNNGSMRGVETLTRFHGPPSQGPDLWISDAAEVGLQVELETAILSDALDLRDELPQNQYLSVNVSPATLVSRQLQSTLDGHDTLGLILELTEHVEIPSERALERAVAHLRNRGVKLAIDDVGSGYAGLSQILRFRPDFLKLDMSLVSGLESDPAKRSLAMAMQHFAREIGARVIAEGIEREEEAYALRMLGIALGQGYHLGRPSPVGELAQMADATV